MLVLLLQSKIQALLKYYIWRKPIVVPDKNTHEHVNNHQVDFTELIVEKEWII